METDAQKRRRISTGLCSPEIPPTPWIRQNDADILLAILSTTEANAQPSPPLCHNVADWTHIWPKKAC